MGSIIQSITPVPRGLSDSPPHHVGVCREAELLLLCVRSRIGPETIQDIKRLIAQDIDWGFFLGAVYTHQLGPLVYWNLTSACPDVVPEGVLNPLKADYNRNAARNLFMTGEVCRILDIFKEHGIPAMSFKGPLQAARIYGNLALRQISDLDFLVRRRNVMAAKEALVAHGFRPGKLFTTEQERAHIYGDAYYDYPFISRDGSFLVEVHWLFLPRQSAFEMDEDFTWEGVVEVTRADRPHLSFPPEEQFLFQCVHNEQHNWRCLKFICDAARMIETYPEMQWDRVLARANRMGRERTILLTLYLASTLLAAPFPAALEERIKARRDVRLYAGLARARMFRDGFRLPWFTEWVECLRRMGAVTEDIGLWGKLACFPGYLKAVMTPERIDRVLFPAMPRCLSFCYCLARVLRFISFHTGVHLPKRKIPIAGVDGNGDGCRGGRNGQIRAL